LIIIGELMNGTRKSIKAAIERRDAEFIADLARRQEQAGADYIDCNPGTVGEQEVADLRWLVQTAQAAVQAPLSLDTPNADALAAALEVYAQDERPMINSITLETERLAAMLPILTGNEVRVVALALDDAGMPDQPGQREDTALRLAARLREEGLAAEDIFVDPLITPLSTDPSCNQHILPAIAAIREGAPDCHITCGLSNISYGLPNRALLNRTFLAQAVAHGLDSAILDPLDRDLMRTAHAAEALAGRDEWCAAYIAAHREGKLD
jgi:cobalamin-dependent methionine synthase I